MTLPFLWQLFLQIKYSKSRIMSPVPPWNKTGLRGRKQISSSVAAISSESAGGGFLHTFDEAPLLPSRISAQNCLHKQSTVCGVKAASLAYNLSCWGPRRL